MAASAATSRKIPSTLRRRRIAKDNSASIQYDRRETAHHRHRRPVATRLGYRHVDTGAMYRAVAWKARQEGIDLSDEMRVAALAERAAFDLDGGRVVIDGHDVAAAIR